jgi:metal-sulfur cluster biosynthetic enzyme
VTRGSGAGETPSAPRGASIRTALCSVHDPCSVGINLPLNVLDMGLVRGWTEVGGHVTIDLVLTSVMCIQASAIVESIERSVAEVSGVKFVVVDIDRETLWDPSFMTARGAASVSRRRRHTLAATRARPQQWREPERMHRDA